MPLKENEAALLIDNSVEYKNGEYYPMMLTSLRTGVRVGELVALKWSDINFEDRLIAVQRTFGRRGYPLPKNNKTRKVDMTPMLARVLKQVQIDQKKWALQNRQPIPEFVFICDSGEVRNPEKFRYALNQCLKLSELRRIKDGDPDKLDSFLNWEEGVVLMDTPLAQGEELLEELNSQHQERNLLM